MTPYFHEEENPTTLTKADFNFLTANLVMDKDLAERGMFNLKDKLPKNFWIIAKMVVPDGYDIAFGQRKAKTPIFCRVDEAGGEIEGRFKIIGSHPTGYPMVDLGTFHTANMDSTAPANRRTNPTPSLAPIWVRNKGYILIAFCPDIDDKTLVYDDVNNTLNIPITKRVSKRRS